MNSEPHIIVVLYSKFSNACKNFVSTAGKMDIMKSIQFVCVDNKEIRNIINKDKNLKVSYLPCMFRIYDSGDIQLFEGKTAFDALKSYNTPTVSTTTSPLITTPLTPPTPTKELPDERMAVSSFHYVEPNNDTSANIQRPIPDTLINKAPESLAQKAARMAKDREESQRTAALPGSPQPQTYTENSSDNYKTML
jgi:hypothetical protein